jgi:hypothetical protein
MKVGGNMLALVKYPPLNHKSSQFNANSGKTCADGLIMRLVWHGVSRETSTNSDKSPPYFVPSAIVSHETPPYVTHRRHGFVVSRETVLKLHNIQALISRTRSHILARTGRKQKSWDVSSQLPTRRVA